MNTILILSGILLAIVSRNLADAAQPVIFQPIPDNVKQSSAIEFITAAAGFSQTNTEIAQIDLNNDDLYEYIAKNTQCSPANGCPYLIVAQSNNDYIIIGEFSGKNISISDKQTHGIRDILVYNQSLNDYQHNTLSWDMNRMQYSFNQKQAG